MQLPRLISCLILGSLFVTLGAGCSGGDDASTTEDIELSIWRVFDEDDSFDTVIEAYQAQHPNVDITYKKLRFDEYKEEVIRAIAEGEGPDILSIHNTWMGEFKDLLQPMPSTIDVSYLETRGTLRKETVLVSQEEPTMSMKALKQQFLGLVVDDVVWPYQPDPKLDPEDRIYGLPLAVDTLALYYNADLLSAAGIAEAPSTWKEFQDAVIAVTKVNSNSVVTQSGVGMGTSDNVERAADILSVLMMQNGTEMLDERGRVSFHVIPEGFEQGVYPALDAVRFYTDFANPTKEVYTWNDTFSSSYDAFVNGQAAMFFGYSYHLPLIKTAAPKLNFAVAPLPQITDDDTTQKVNYANYWIESVAKSSENSDYAWSFVLFAAEAEHVQSYLTEANKPTALRSLINTQLDNEDIGVFAEQLLTAKTWYRGTDVDAAEEGLYGLIDTILEGTDEPEEAVEYAAEVVSQTY